MLLKNLWCGKMSLRVGMASATVFGLLLLAACGGDSGTSASSDNGASGSEEIQSSSSSPKVESSSSFILSGDSHEESSSSSSVELNCSALLEGATDWNWNVPKECRFNSEIAYDSMTDPRDGQIYKTVKIGDHVWMAENLNYADSVKTPSLLKRSWCYNNKAENCAVAGRLYTWLAAIDSLKLATDADNPQDCDLLKSCTLPDTVQGICPPGWHLPAYTEWLTLFTEVGGESSAGKLLKSQKGWYERGDGTDAYGFSALPAGLRYGGGAFGYGGYYAYFWSATESTFSINHSLSFDAYYMYLFGSSEEARMYSLGKDRAFSIRCLKDGTSSGNPKVKSSSSSKDETKSSSSNQSSSSNEDNEIDGDWCWDMPKEAYLNPEIAYDSMTDPRDGQIYKTVKIGNQVWMAENLNYADSVKTPSLLKHSWCYKNKTENCAVAGRLYTWAAAIDSVKFATDADNPQDCGYGKTCTLPAKVQGICPDGWHLPTKTEWETLFIEAGGKSTAEKNLKSQNGWDISNGTDAFGFSAIPAGLGRTWIPEGFYFFYKGDYAFFWSATESIEYIGNIRAYSMELDYDYELENLDGSDKAFAYSVRCLKDL